MRRDGLIRELTVERVCENYIKRGGGIRAGGGVGDMERVRDGIAGICGCGRHNRFGYAQRGQRGSSSERQRRAEDIFV